MELPRLRTENNTEFQVGVGWVGVSKTFKYLTIPYDRTTMEKFATRYTKHHATQDFRFKTSCARKALGGKIRASE